MTALGQDTGQTPERMKQEAMALLNVIAESDPENRLSESDLKFYKDTILRSCFPKMFTISGKQLYWLRDIKDRLL